jgi:CIC family chloride channel protein
VVHLPVQAGERGHNALSTLRLFALAIVVGVAVGGAADGFRWLLPHTNQLFFGAFHAGDVSVASASYVLRRPYIVVLPALGGLLVGIFLHFVTQARGHGVAEVLAAMETRGSRIAPVVGVYTAIASSVTIGSGGSAGPEGPAIQIGSAIGSGIGQGFHLSLDDLRTLLACGAATGLAALYNAPLAGTLFAVEVLLEEIRPQRFALIALSAVSGHYVASHLIVNQNLASVSYQQNAWQGIPLDLGLGLLAAPVGVGFILLLHRIAEASGELKLWPWLRPALGGLMVGCLGLLLPRILGTGEETIRQAVLGLLPFGLLLVLPLCKLLATALTLGSGGSGGVFTPSLFMGATLGTAYGIVARHFIPGLAPEGAFGMVGMGTVLAAAVNAPLTAIVIVIELTGDFQILPGLATAVAGSVLLARYLYPESIYTLPLVLRGIQRPPMARNPLAAVRVRQALRADWPTVQPEVAITDAIEHSQRGGQAVLPVIDAQGYLRGMLHMSEVAHAIGSDEGGAPLPRRAGDLATPASVVAYPEETLHDVLRRPGAADLQVIPVVSSSDHRYLGVLERSAMLRLYSR